MSSDCIKVGFGLGHPCKHLPPVGRIASWGSEIVDEEFNVAGDRRDFGGGEGARLLSSLFHGQLK